MGWCLKSVKEYIHHDYCVCHYIKMVKCIRLNDCKDGEINVFFLDLYIYE